MNIIPNHVTRRLKLVKLMIDSLLKELSANNQGLDIVDAALVELHAEITSLRGYLYTLQKGRNGKHATKT